MNRTTPGFPPDIQEKAKTRPDRNTPSLSPSLEIDFSQAAELEKTLVAFILGVDVSLLEGVLCHGTDVRSTCKAWPEQSAKASQEPAGSQRRLPGFH